MSFFSSSYHIHSDCLIEVFPSAVNLMDPPSQRFPLLSAEVVTIGLAYFSIVLVSALVLQPFPSSADSDIFMLLLMLVRVILVPVFSQFASSLLFHVYSKLLSPMALTVILPPSQIYPLPLSIPMVCGV